MRSVKPTSAWPTRLSRPDWPAGSVNYTGPDEPNPRVVDVIANDEEDPERFKVLVGEEVLVREG